MRGAWRAVQRFYVKDRLDRTIVVDPKGVDGFDTEAQAFGWAQKVVAMSKDALTRIGSRLN